MERENYSKVELHKQMLLQPVHKSEATVEILQSKGSPGLVKRRVLEMTQHSSPTSGRRQAQNNHNNSHHQNNTTSNGNGNSSSSPKVNSRFSKTNHRTSGSPRLESKRSMQSSDSRNRLLMAPKPYKSSQHSEDRGQPRSTSFKTGLASPTSRMAAASTASSSPQRSQSLPKRSAAHNNNNNTNKKPAVPPKPRHVKVNQYSSNSPQKSSTSTKAPILGKKKTLEDTSFQSDQNDSGVSEEADDVFNESPINCSFTSLSQKMDDQRYDLLKRRQSYSEFEDLIEKKRELRERMMSKIMLLREERDILLAEKSENDALGKKIAKKLERQAQTMEIDKYHQFLEEIEQITKLTVSLTIRLSRLSKKIETGSFSKDELVIQKKKKSKLAEQLQETEYLQRNTDRRSNQVRKIIAKYLDESDLNDYDAFLVNLIKHITDLKETEQRIQLGEEQLVALNDNLVAIN